jgi:hypothetical protein
MHEVDIKIKVLIQAKYLNSNPNFFDILQILNQTLSDFLVFLKED